MAKSPMLSVVVPLYNEGSVLKTFHADLQEVVQQVSPNSYEIIYCNDGSTDNTAEIVQECNHHNPHIKLLSLSRNFGKESALSAGIEAANGQAILTIDGDGQHPVKLIPAFVDEWKKGTKVVIGVRTNASGKGWSKTTGPKLFYKLLNKLADQHLVPGSSDYRLIDQSIQKVFLSLKETERFTRGLINWLGFERTYIPFEAEKREMGSAGYSLPKLVGLATNSFVSLSPRPLYLFGYLGMFITLAAFMLGTSVFIEQILLNDPLRWKFTGTAMLGILTLFLVGIVLLSQGILSLYVSHIHNQSRRRPLYVIDYSHSVGLKEDNEN